MTEENLEPIEVKTSRAEVQAVLGPLEDYLYRLSPPPVKEESFDRITVGMSRAEVEAILGPPGDYRNGPGETEHVRDRIGPWDFKTPDDDANWRPDGQADFYLDLWLCEGSSRAA